MWKQCFLLLLLQLHLFSSKVSWYQINGSPWGHLCYTMSSVFETGTPSVIVLLFLSTFQSVEEASSGLNGNHFKSPLGWYFAIFFICRKKVSGDYEALNERLQTLPDQLSYDIMVGEILTANNTTQPLFSIVRVFGLTSIVLHTGAVWLVSLHAWEACAHQWNYSIAGWQLVRQVLRKTGSETCGPQDEA